jgi:hypothetical protein
MLPFQECKQFEHEEERIYYQYSSQTHVDPKCYLQWLGINPWVRLVKARLEIHKERGWRDLLHLLNYIIIIISHLGTLTSSLASNFLSFY